MGFKIDKNGNISMIQGDSGLITIRGLNPEKNFSVYFAIRDKNRQIVGNELTVSSNYSSSVVFTLTGDYTNQLTVKRNEPYAVYYYGIKICDSGDQRENTLVIGSGGIESQNTITVYPLKVEGM